MTPHDDTNTLAELYESGEADHIDDSDRDVAERIRSARAAADLGVDELAAQLGVQVGTIEEWESGRSMPSGHRLSRLAGLLGVSLSWLVVGHGVEPIERDQAISELRNAIASTRTQLNDALVDLEQRLELLTAD